MAGADWPSSLAGWRLQAVDRAVDIVRARVGERPPMPRADERGLDPDTVARIRLAALGERVANELRGAWDRAAWATRPETDPHVAAMWRRWASGGVFADQRAWISLLEKVVVGAFRQALSGRPLPGDVLARATGDLRDALFYQLLGGREGSGFREVASFVLETAPTGPVTPLLGVLSPAARTRVAGCVTRRGHWPQTVARVLDAAPGPDDRALWLAGSTTPEDADGWIDLHVVMRLVDGWGEDPGDPDHDWVVLRQNHGRARGRLRAVAAAESPERLAAALGALPALTERTRAGARRWAWAWAWEALATGFVFDLGQPVVRPCKAGAGPEPVDAEELAALHCWALLVLLRGRATTLRRWCREGSGDRDGTWGRLVAGVPIETDGSHARVRAALTESWDRWLGDVTPAVRAVAGLPPGRNLRQAFEDALVPWWHPAVPWPRSGFPSMVRHARDWLHGSEGEARLPRPSGAT